MAIPPGAPTARSADEVCKKEEETLARQTDKLKQPSQENQSDIRQKSDKFAKFFTVLVSRRRARVRFVR
jgi:hypothetical protein